MAMDTPDHLLSALTQPGEQYEALEAWNEEIEGLLKDLYEQGHAEAKVSHEPVATVSHVSRELHRRLLCAFSKEMSNVLSSDFNTYDSCGSDEYAKKVLATWKTFDGNKTLAVDALTPLIRASKNWLRWYLQFYASAQRRKNQKDEIQDFKSESMLEFYLCLLDELCSVDAVHARAVAQVLFYSTFNPIPSSDAKMQQSYAFLIQKCDCFSRILKNLTNTDSIPLCVSLVRNVHNLAASYQTAAKVLVAKKISLSSGTKLFDIPDDEASHHEIFRGLLEHCLNSEPDFPGDKDDLRHELVQEILRTFYAVRTGQRLSADAKLLEILCDLLRNTSTDKRTIECKLTAVSVLMDASSGIDETVQDRGAVASLVDLFNLQIDDVISNTRVSNAAAAVLTPLLVVLIRFCKGNTTLLATIKETVFPAADEPKFSSLVTEEKKSSAKAKNMKPLDAPDGSVRKNVIRLLTWPESHIKRFSGELLWLLCNTDPEEFTYRVGLGNALPFLSVKGFAQLPAGAIS